MVRALNRPRALLRGLLAAAGALLLVTCSESPMAPRGNAALSVRPQWGPSVRFAPLLLDQARLVVADQATGKVLLDVTRPFDPASNQLTLDETVPLGAATLDVVVTLELYAGQTLLFSGQSNITLTRGASTRPATPVLTYVGPGANAAAVVVAPRDSVVRTGATVLMRATASDNAQQPVADFYAHWSVIGATSATIDAGGTLSTGASRDTFFVKALLPNGVNDSARVFVLPAPAALVKQGGDNQTGTTGSRLAQLLAVQVNGADGFPVPGASVTFAAATGGGSVDSASTTTDAQGIARTGATLGAAAGTQTYTASATGLTAVTFTATATALTTTRTWNGTTSSDWSVAANWTPAAVPTNANDVVIPAGTPNSPAITASCSALSLTVNATATLGLGAFNCQVGGNVFADGQITGAGAVQLAATSQVRGRISNLQVSGAVTAVGQLSVSGNVTTTGATGDLIMNGHKANISGNLTTQGGALFTMTNILDTVQVLGNALFSGGSTAGHLTQGALIVGGGFTQSTTASSFSAGGNHRVVILGAVNHAIAFSDPVNSRFQGLDLGSNAATYTLASNVTVLGQLISKPPGITPPVVTTASGAVLTAGGADITLLTFNGVPLVLSGGSIGAFSSVVFSSQPTNRAQLTVNNTGSGGPFTFTGVSFSPTPVAPNGFYMDVTDLDGATSGVLTITMATPTPATPGAFLRTTGGAVVNWPSTTTLTWTGVADANFANAANWSPAVAPAPTSDIVIPPTTTSPVLGSNLTVKSLTVNPGATFNIGANTLNVNGSVLIDGALAGIGTVQQVGNGQLHGSFPALVVGATATVNGPLATTAGNLNISVGNLILNGHTVTTNASINTVNGGVLTMTNALDTVIAVNAGFGGGDQAGLLTAGAIRLSGSLSTTGSTPASRGPLNATGTHAFIFTGAGSHLMQALAGATTLSLANLDISGTTGDIAVTTLTPTAASLQITGTLTAKPTGAPVVFHGVPTATVQARSVNISRLGVDTMRFILGQTGVTITQFDSVAFTHQDPAQTQLTVSHPGAATPFTFTALSFGATPSTGRYLAAVDEAPADGQVLTLNLVGATPATPGAFTSVVGGAVINWPPAAPAVTWTGNVSGDWSVAGNWSTNAVPGTTDSVVIPVTAVTPFLSAVTTVGAVNVSGGTLAIGAQTLIVARSFSTNGNGKLDMTDPGAAMVVGGDAVFAGGNETGLLTDGGITFGGNFTQLSGTSTSSYAASGNHLSVITGDNPTVSFASPAAAQSHFQNFAWSGTGSLTLLSNLLVAGTAVASNGTSTISSAGGFRFTAGAFANGNPVTFNNVPLTIDNAAGDNIALVNLTFQNMATNVSQLAIRHPGLGNSYTLTGLVFGTTPVAPNGFYLDVNDVTGAADGGLTIQVSATPSSPGGFVTTAGGAVVQWPGPQSITWTGQVNGDWAVAGNWSSNAVPSAIDQVTIPPVANQPTLLGDVVVGSVRVSGAGARLRLNGHTLTANGLITDTDGLLVMTSTTDLAILGSAAFQGGDETGFLSAGEIRVSGDFTVGQQTSTFAFRPTGSHRVVMTNPSQLQTISICCAAGASGFQNLDISQSFGINIQFSNNGVFVADTFIVQPAAGLTPWLYMLGSPLTARRFKVSRLTVDRGTITLNENGVLANQQFDNVTFQGYLPSQTQLQVIAVGASLAPRPLTFNGLQFQTLAGGSTGKYINVTSTTGTLNFLLPGNNQGPTNGPLFQTIVGNVIVGW
ncbi:MAG: hypothetical protein U0133_02310 [Gemmatimonadales bacterium]